MAKLYADNFIAAHDSQIANQWKAECADYVETERRIMSAAMLGCIPTFEPFIDSEVLVVE